MLRVFLFGHVRVAATDSYGVVPVAAAAERLLGYLLVHRRAPIPRRHAAFELWPDASESEALARLRRHVHLLRRQLPRPVRDRPWVLADRASVRWNPESDYWLDIEAFEALCDPLTCLDRDAAAHVEIADLERAVDLYADDLLVDNYDDWVLVGRERLRHTLGCALHRLVGLHAATGNLRAAATLAERLVRHDPLVEESHRLLVALRYLGGDRGAALSAFRACQRVLADELSVEPMPETMHLADAIRRSVAPERILRLVETDLPEGTDVARVLAPRPPHNLPVRLTEFVGRTSEKAAVEDLIAGHRLVTLVGPCGCGKTRLALEIAFDLVEHGEPPRGPPVERIGNAARPALPDGIWWIDLAPIEDGTLVADAIAAVLGCRPEPGVEVVEMLQHHLRPRTLLLLLDNVEHVTVASADLAQRILGAAEGVRILATSREPLGISGEATWLLHPLRLPPTDRIATAEVLAGHEATRLFVSLARLADPRFQLDAVEAAIVARICRRLDGLPLALELAAAQTRALSVAEIDARLEDRFRLLVGESRSEPEHHASLEAAMDWSHDLLSEPERVLFRRLSVFRGGWTLEAAEAVCADAVLDARYVLLVLGSLVARSLVATGSSIHGGDRRYRMLRTIRHYAATQLAASGAGDETRGRHLAHYGHVAATASEELKGPRQADWLARLETEQANIDAALQWAIDSGQADAGLRMAGELGRFWELRGHLAHGRRWLSRFLALPGLDAATAARASALRASGSLAEEQGDYAVAATCYEQALAICRQLDDRPGVARLLSDMGNVADFQADYASAMALHEEALAIRRSLGDVRAIAISLNNLGNVAELQGDYGRARELYTESLHLMNDQADRWVVSVILNNLGRLAMDTGRLDEARSRLGESLDIAREMGDRQGIAYALHNLGEVARLEGDLRTARQRQAQSLATSIELGNSQGVAASLEALAEVAHGAGDAERSVRLLASADALRERIGAPVTANEAANRTRTLADLRRALGHGAFERAWEAGRLMSEVDAAALAVADRSQDASDA